MVKVHTQLDLKGNIPSFFVITKAKVYDVNFLDDLEFEKDAIYIMDRGYFDFRRLQRIHKEGVFFIIRSKESLLSESSLQKSENDAQRALPLAIF